MEYWEYNMKKTLLFILFSILLITCGCQNIYDQLHYVKTTSQSLDEYKRSNDSLSVFYYVIPFEGVGKKEYSPLLKDYEYENGRYFEKILFDYIDNPIGFMYIVYEDEKYEMAKDYIFNSSEEWIDFDVKREYKGFVFYNSYFNDSSRSNYYYRQAGFNDDKKTLVFYSMYVDKRQYPEMEYFETDFPQFLEFYFGDFYDFEEGEPVEAYFSISSD